MHVLHPSPIINDDNRICVGLMFNVKCVVCTFIYSYCQASERIRRKGEGNRQSDDIHFHFLERKIFPQNESLASKNLINYYFNHSLNSHQRENQKSTHNKLLKRVIIYYYYYYFILYVAAYMRVYCTEKLHPYFLNIITTFFVPTETSSSRYFYRFRVSIHKNNKNSANTKSTGCKQRREYEKKMFLVDLS